MSSCRLMWTKHIANFALRAAFFERSVLSAHAQAACKKPRAESKRHPAARRQQAPMRTRHPFHHAPTARLTCMRSNHRPRSVRDQQVHVPPSCTPHHTMVPALPRVRTPRCEDPNHLQTKFKPLPNFFRPGGPGSAPGERSAHPPTPRGRTTHRARFGERSPMYALATAPSSPHSRSRPSRRTTRPTTRLSPYWGDGRRPNEKSPTPYRATLATASDRDAPPRV